MKQSNWIIKDVLLGMSIQAVISASLGFAGIINLTAKQQFLAGILFTFTAIIFDKSLRTTKGMAIQALGTALISIWFPGYVDPYPLAITGIVWSLTIIGMVGYKKLNPT